MKHFNESWRNPTEEQQAIYKDRLNSWKREEGFVTIEKPTRIDRAHSLGYKAKQGILVVRQRVIRGGRMRPKFKKGRRSKRRGRRKILLKNYQQVAEERVQRQFTNMQVLNSYYLARDKEHRWYEVILVDPHHPVLKKDFAWMLSNPGRVYHGKTSAGQRSRGLHKRRGLEKGGS